MPYDFKLSSTTLPTGRVAHYAQLNNSAEQKFVIGYKTLYDGNFGLFNTSVDNTLVYKPEDFENTFGFWAYFIYPTAMAESKGSFFCLNTYDRAKFTFTFMQFAAHVPNGDFVTLFRKLLAMPKGKDYFPKLKLISNRIHYVNTNGTTKQLEDDSSTASLMDYLNPGLSEVETQELICSARFIHWAKNEASHRKCQVETAIELMKNNMRAYHRRFGLNNAPADVCAVICDIRHQGRATNDRIAAALDTNGDYTKALNNLLTIGNSNYGERINTVKRTLNALKTGGLFSKKYNASTNSFSNL